jgi:hypothetical protein
MYICIYLPVYALVRLSVEHAPAHAVDYIRTRICQKLSQVDFANMNYELLPSKNLIVVRDTLCKTVRVVCLFVCVS